MKPWELNEYSFEEFLISIKGHEMREAVAWDRVRHIMFTQAKAAGAKNIRKVSDIMKLPLIDGTGGKVIRENLIRRLKEYKEKNGGANPTSGN